jgi:hypothetical protein
LNLVLESQDFLKTPKVTIQLRTCKCVYLPLAHDTPWGSFELGSHQWMSNCWMMEQGLLDNKVW